MNNLEFFIGAYFIFWAGTLFYLFILHRRQKAIQRTLQELEAKLSSSDS